MAVASGTAVRAGGAECLAVSATRTARGELRVPGDKSISHRALLLAALAAGPSEVTGLSRGQDVQHTLGVVGQFGVECGWKGDLLRVGGGLRHEPADVLDHGNAGTGIRLTAGVCAGVEGVSVQTGDRFLRARPMDRVAVPLREMGARVDGRQDGLFAPLVIRGGGLRGITYRPPVASAQVKSAVLLAGLRAVGSTTVVEPHPTRAHTEEMITAFGGRVVVEGPAVTVYPGPLQGTRVRVPGDPSQAAFWVVAAVIASDGEVAVEDVYLGGGRADFARVLARMGAGIEVDPSGGVITARASRLRGVEITAADVPGIVDEIPVLAVAAACAEGVTHISGAAELRVKESDRVASTAGMLRAFGVQVMETEDGMVITGRGGALRGGQVDACGDHRIAMAAAVAAACAVEPGAESRIPGWESVATSYPGFAEALRALTGADPVVSPAG